MTAHNLGSSPVFHTNLPYFRHDFLQVSERYDISESVGEREYRLVSVINVMSFCIHSIPLLFRAPIVKDLGMNIIAHWIL